MSDAEKAVMRAAKEWREAREDVLGCSKVEAGQYDRLAMAEHALAKAAVHIP